MPFIDYARADGLAIGPGQAAEWTPVPIDDSTDWVDGYRGLFGLDTRDRFAGERAPAGPKYGRAGTVRQSWNDPVGLRRPLEGRTAIPPAEPSCASRLDAAADGAGRSRAQVDRAGRRGLATARRGGRVRCPSTHRWQSIHAARGAELAAAERACSSGVRRSPACATRSEPSSSSSSASSEATSARRPPTCTTPCIPCRPRPRATGGWSSSGRRSASASCCWRRSSCC